MVNHNYKGLTQMSADKIVCVGKHMDAAILGPWIPYDSFENYMDVEFQFTIDGSLRQCAKGREMMMPPEALLVYISKYFPLKANDIIFTGTPAGVTSVSRNSTAELRWDKYSYRVNWGSI